MLANRLAVLSLVGASLVAGQVLAQEYGGGGGQEGGGKVFGGTATDLRNLATGSFRAKSVSDAVDQFSEDRLPTLIPGYVGTDPVNGTLDFRGVPMSLSYLASSTTLNFSVPEIGFATSFTGATRQESNRLLAEFLKNNTDFQRRLGKALVAKSPADPLAGNPLSLQSTMIAGDFAAALAAVSPFLEDDEPSQTRLFKPYMVAQTGGAVPALRTPTAVGGLGGGAISGSSLSFQQIRANGLTVPLQYNARSDIDPRRGFSFRVPLNVSSYEGSLAGGVNLAFGYRYPITRRWIIMPAVGYGLTASTDLGTVGSMVSGSVTSALGFKLDSVDLVVANMVGYFKSLAAPGSNYSYDPGISNVAFKNGVVVSRPVPIFGAQRAVQGYLYDTRTTGAALFVDDWQEAGVTVGSRPRVNLARDYGSLSLGYLRSTSYKGLTVQASYLF